MNQQLLDSRLGAAGVVTRGSQHGSAVSHETATAFVINAIESTGAATRNDFDIERIVTTAHAMIEDWDMKSLQSHTFWRIASACIRH